MFHAAMSALSGAAVGLTAVSVSGMTAVGMIGGGAGFGAAAGPVGASVGALAGLAMYGIAWAIGG